MDTDAQFPLDFYAYPVKEVAGPHPSGPPGAIYPEMVKLGPFVFRLIVVGLEADEILPEMPVKKIMN